MFTDPITRVGGEKCSYHIPTYEGLKGIAKSIYWKPTLVWVIDSVRVMKRIRTQTKGTKPLNYSGGNTLAIYTFLTGDPDPGTGVPQVEYQVRAHFEWNQFRPELAHDRNNGKHYQMALRSLERGGRFWRPQMLDGVIRFPRPEDCPVRKEIRPMQPKRFEAQRNLRSVEDESEVLEGLA
jgi:CRISPR-associated protein Cas5d